MITLKTLPDATEQEVFDQVARHLLRQMKRSAKFNSEGAEACLYRGEGGLACAAGCLIADDEYIELMENQGWVKLNRQGIVPDQHYSFIDDLQKIHDLIEPKDWRERLVILSDRKGLTFPSDL